MLHPSHPARSPGRFPRILTTLRTLFGHSPRRPSPDLSARLPFARRIHLEPLEDRRMLSTLFVDADAAPGGDGLSWATAFDDLQAGLDAAEVANGDADAENDVDAIWIAEGVYRPSARLEANDSRSASFSLVDGLTLYGGFAGTESSLAARDWTVHETVLSGDIKAEGDVADNAYTVVYCGEGVEVGLDGVFVVEGNANATFSPEHLERVYGGGIYSLGIMTLVNCTLGQNSADYSGGAVYVNSGELTVLNSTISGNSAARSGGGMWIDGTMAVIDSVVSENTVGGGIHSRGDVWITNSKVIGNIGGGIYCNGVTQVTNSTIAGNRSEDPGGGIINYETMVITNSTIAGNAADYGGGISNHGEMTLINSIVALNSGGDFDGYQTISEASKNNLFGIDPKFVRNPGTNGADDPGDLRLTGQSPAIDLGDSCSLPEDRFDMDADGNISEPIPLDSDGNSRVFGECVDIGAYEYQNVPAEGRETPSTIVTTAVDTSDLYDGQVSLREAIYYARTTLSGERVSFAPTLSGATIELSGSSVFIDEGVAVDASSLVDGLTVDANGRSRVFTVFAHAHQSVEIVGLTISGGYAREGGGIHNSTSLFLRDIHLLGNSAKWGGGGVYNLGDIHLSNSTLSGNAAENSGGGVRSTGTLTAVGCTIAGNSGGEGGGIYSSGELTLANSLVVMNGVDGLVGALSEGSTGNLIGIDPRFVRNPGTNGTDDYGDLRLTATSPAIDRGTIDGLPLDTWDQDMDGNTTESLPFDLDGNSRVVGMSVDVGAYEFQSSPSEGRESPSSTVDTSADVFDLHDGQVSLREAIYYVGHGVAAGTITFVPELAGSTILLGGTELVIDSGLIIDGSIAVQGITIDGDSRSRVFRVIAPSDEMVELRGLTITNGNASESRGGGIFNSGSLAISNLEILGNASDTGGAVYNTIGALDVTNCVIRNNSSRWSGGIHNYAGTVAVTASVLSHNSSDACGAIYNSYGTMSITDSTISENVTTSWGAVYHRVGTMTLSNSTISRNVTKYDGGGIFSGGELNVMNCAIIENQSQNDGGGVYSTGTTTIVNSRLLGNSAQRYGGGIYARVGVLAIAGSTLSGNHALYGSGIHNAGDATIASCTVAGNSSREGGGIDSSGPLTLINSIVALNPNADVVGKLSDGSTNNIIGGYPAFARNPGANGDDDYGDLRLSAQSAAINAGLYDQIPPDTLDVDADGNIAERLPLDLDGNPRLFGAAVDIGAYEYQSQPPDGRETASSVVTTAADTFNPYDGEISLREAISHAEKDLSNRCVTFSVELSGSTILLDGYALRVARALTIDASSLAGLTIDAGGKSRVFNIASVSDDPVELIGLRIENGHAFQGGGITGSASLRLTDCALEGNISDRDGGAVYCAAGTLAATDCRFVGNTAKDGNGGAIYNAEGAVTLTTSLVSSNSSRRGGGVCADSGTLTVIRSTMSENSAMLDGGAIYSTEGTMTVICSSIMENSSGDYGGGISNHSGIATIMNSVFSLNSARYGGGFRQYGGFLSVVNCTVCENTASRDGGGVYAFVSPEMLFHNTIIARNTADRGSDVYRQSSAISGSHNLIGDGTGQTALVNGENGNLVGTAESPIDPFFIRPSSDGGDGWGDDPDTLDIDESLNNDYGDLRLRPDSPAIDAGSNDLLPADVFDLDGDGDITEPIPFDLAGNARVENGTVDMGAYEYVTPVFVAGDLNGDEMVGGADLDIVRANWGRSVAAGSLLDGDPSGDGVVGGADLDIVRANWGSTAPAAAGVDVVLGRESEPEAPETGSETVYGPRRREVAKETVENMALQDRQAIWAAVMNAWEHEWRARFR